MDSLRLIELVKQHEELYNPSHPLYHTVNQRKKVWAEISRAMNQSAKACKADWVRIKDRHRKAMSLRKYKEDRGLPAMKPPKDGEELSFLTPYLFLDTVNVYPKKKKKKKKAAASTSATTKTAKTTKAVRPVPTCIPLKLKLPSGDVSNGCLPASGTAGVRREINDTSKSSSSDTHLLARHLRRSALSDFFMNMAQTVKNFPVRDQIQIKAQLFQIVSSVEMRLASEGLPLNHTTHSNDIAIQEQPHHYADHSSVKTNDQPLVQVTKLEPLDDYNMDSP